MAGYACSFWYFLRFTDTKNTRELASRASLDYWLPVDVYSGGVEHARSHLLYSRFWTKVLFDAGYIGFDEPFLTLRNQGSLLAYTPGRKPRHGEILEGEADDDTDKIIDWIVLKPEEREVFPADQIVWRWARMSKSKGNVVTPDEMAEKYGADSLRLCIMFVAPFGDNVMWKEEAIKGSYRFLSRVWRWIMAFKHVYKKDWRTGRVQENSDEANQLRRALHLTIKRVSNDIETFQFNTAIAALMEFTNELYALVPVGEGYDLSTKIQHSVLSEVIEGLTLSMAPFTPHMCEEIWEQLGHSSSIAKAQWPNFDPQIIAADTLTIIFQVNGKLRGQGSVPVGTTKDALVKLALENEKVKAYVEGKRIAKSIVILDKLVNIVVADN
jgi:leucyl-tRNA synthetase